jgi:hypothetical protein
MDTTNEPAPLRYIVNGHTHALYRADELAANGYRVVSVAPLHDDDYRRQGAARTAYAVDVVPDTGADRATR